MKIKVLLILSISLFGIYSCNREDIYPDPYMSDSYDMVCKDKGPLKGEGPESNQTCVDWEYDGDSTLQFTHYNAGFNCCPEAILTSMKISGDTIYISERDSMQLCRCNCLYDIDFSIHNLRPQKYIVEFVEAYVVEPSPPLVFEIDLKDALSGKVCQDRDYYPWGKI